MTKAIRVLLLVENNGYPADFRVRREAHALRDAGYAVSVVCPRTGSQAWTERADDIAVYRFPAPPGGKGPFSYAFEFLYATVAMLLLSAWVALRRGVDVVHAANPPDTLFVVGAFLKLFGKKFIFDHHDLAPEIYLSRFKRRHQGVVHGTLRLLERCSYAVSDAVIATNESYRQRAIERGRKRPETVFVVRNGPPASYQPLPPAPLLVARAVHLVGYVGTIGPQDGLDCWLRAIRHMVFTFNRRDFLAVIIGDGDAYQSVRTLASELGIDTFVHFTGRLSELESRRCLSAVAICVQPDPSSPLNDRSTMNKLMEYMALGKAVVAFDLPETRVSGGDAAVYVAADDELEFARQVGRLFDDRAECDRLGSIGRARVANGLAWEYSVPHLLSAYAAVLGRAKPSSDPLAIGSQSRL